MSLPTFMQSSTVSLTFTPANWRNRQFVTISAVEDFVKDGNKRLNIVTGRSFSADRKYSNKAIPDVSVRTIDSKRVAWQPSAPLDLSAIPSTTSALLSWSPPADGGNSEITLYQIWYARDYEQQWTLNQVSTVRSATVSGLTPGATYKFAISAINSAERISNRSAVVSTTLPLPVSPPTPPTDVVATAGDSQVAISWQPTFGIGSAPPTGYRVDWSTQVDFGTFASASTLSTSLSVPQLSNGITYFLRVLASSTAGPSVFSNVVVATPRAPGLEIPRLAFEPSNNQLKLSWPAAAQAGNTFNVLWSANGTDFNPLATTASTSQIVSVSNRNVFAYRVDAVSPSGSVTKGVPQWASAVRDASSLPVGFVTAYVQSFTASRIALAASNLEELAAVSGGFAMASQSMRNTIADVSMEMNRVSDQYMAFIRDSGNPIPLTDTEVLKAVDLRASDNLILDNMLVASGVSALGAMQGADDFQRLQNLIGAFYESLVQDTLTGAQRAVDAVPGIGVFSSVANAFAPTATSLTNAAVSATFLGITAALESGVDMVRGQNGQSASHRETFRQTWGQAKSSAVDAASSYLSTRLDNLESGSSRDKTPLAHALTSLRKVAEEMVASVLFTTARWIYDNWSAFTRSISPLPNPNPTPSQYPNDSRIAVKRLPSGKVAQRWEVSFSQRFAPELMCWASFELSAADASNKALALFKYNDGSDWDTVKVAITELE